MSRKFDELIAVLEHFDNSTLTDDGVSARFEILRLEELDSTIGNIYRDLYEIQDCFESLTSADQTSALPSMFGLLEKAGDFETGSGMPGPIVHAIESSKEYFPF